MSDFEYIWSNKEANFGPPVPKEVSGGTHISIENIPKYQGKYIALRRPYAIPGHEVPQKAQNNSDGLLYFIHNLPRWGEDLETYIHRVVLEQSGVSVKEFKVAHLEMEVYKDTNQWAWTPYTFVELEEMPVPGNNGNKITEVVSFTKNSIPDEFGWWEKEELIDFLNKYDS
ncbi:hypothetical protein HYX70_02970 [Candidatus Saccharibacteria bacterium]|nr:hypothetical protein [Candidatus Saccharibacteria bacterium]